MIKLVIADLDGTLLDDSKNVTPEFWELEQVLHAKGILFSPASGRQYYNLLEMFAGIKDRCVFIAENGTYVVYRGQQLHLDAMDRNMANTFIVKGRTLPGTDLILCGKEAAYVEHAEPDFLREARTYYKRLEIVPDLTAVDDLVLKVTLCNFAGSEEHIYPHFKEYERDFKVAISGRIWIDITNNTADKGAAIKNIQEYFNITFDETLVFGDFLNDLEMMSAGKYSYAMKNAHPVLIEAASFVTRYDNNNNGVADTIREFVQMDA